MKSITLLQGHVLNVLSTLAAKSIQCGITSPPYLGLREYGTEPIEWGGVSFSPMVGLPEIHIAGCEAGCRHVWGELQPCHHPGQVAQTNTGNPQAAKNGQTASSGQFCQRCGGWRGSLGLEPDPWMFVGHLVLIFREVYRVLRDDGTLWVNLSDTYKDKQLLGIPWKVALALQADGWILRNDNIWHKKAPMPSSAKDRCTVSHEYMFMFSKKKRYYFDMEAIKEPAVCGENRATFRGGGAYTNNRSFNNSAIVQGDGEIRERPKTTTRHKRTVWTASEPLFRLRQDLDDETRQRVIEEMIKRGLL